MKFVPLHASLMTLALFAVAGPCPCRVGIRRRVVLAQAEPRRQQPISSRSASSSRAGVIFRSLDDERLQQRLNRAKRFLNERRACRPTWPRNWTRRSPPVNAEIERRQQAAAEPARSRARTAPEQPPAAAPEQPQAEATRLRRRLSRSSRPSPRRSLSRSPQPQQQAQPEPQPRAQPQPRSRAAAAPGRAAADAGGQAQQEQPQPREPPRRRAAQGSDEVDVFLAVREARLRTVR